MPWSLRVRSAAPCLALAIALALSGCKQQGNTSAAVAGKQRATARSTADTTTTCTLDGAHALHTASCTTCHGCGDVLQFDPSGAAVGANLPAPQFDSSAKSCSNVACHGVAPGTYTYTTWDYGLDQPVDVSVSYGSAPRQTPSWYTTSAVTCDACHDNPPRNGTWHSGYHGNQGPSGALNQCQLCHPDASGANGAGTTITNAALHGDGTANVQPHWTTTCFYCH